MVMFKNCRHRNEDFGLLFVTLYPKRFSLDDIACWLHMKNKNALFIYRERMMERREECEENIN